MNEDQMKTESKKIFPCILCKKRTRPNDRKKCESTAIRRFLRKNFLGEANSNDILCNKCRHRYHGNQKTCQQKSSSLPVCQPLQPGMCSPPSISLPLQRTPSSHAYCLICKRPGPKLVVVSSAARFSAFLHHEIIIPPGSRCCPSHIDEGEFRPGVLTKIQTFESSFVNKSTVLELIQKIRNYALQTSTSRFSFELSTMSNSDYMALTGISKENFEDLHSFISSDIRNTQNRGTRMSLGIFLLKLRSGMSNQLLATIFGISKSSLCRAVKSVRTALMKSFVPHHLGLQHTTREEIIENHTRPLAQELFGDFTNKKAIAVLDGTYIYIQKSNNFQFQRKSYSLHKGRPLVKPMVVTSTDGYFLTVLGPYLARNNDATILNHMLHTNVEDLKGWFHEDDVFVVDRGFRDSVDMLEELGIRAEMPRLMSRGQKQMTTLDANASRLVTKIRWVVEAANARIKRWKYLAHVLPTNQVPFIGDYVRIVCALSNRYCKPLSTGSEDEDMALACKMRKLSA
ncbi:uncharacterized protein LOC128174533 [Crassostrea angulata]|uniref:uncharacterized protein LOC128174533 n=1 Tax=Magallana angulata TaxID=2784310 RepID=UPI0022B20D47|nr:uncharacterized protein LOC128174533 [Crassostrea angulata]